MIARPKEDPPRKPERIRNHQLPVICVPKASPLATRFFKALWIYPPRRVASLMLLNIIVKAVILVLLLAATLLQPSLALPATCTLPGQNRVVTCAGCCVSGPCCSVRDQSSAVRLAAVANSVAADQSVAATASFSIAISSELSPPVGRVSLTSHGSVSHAPPPRALSCIRLI